MDPGSVGASKLRLDDPGFVEKFATAAMNITLPASMGCAPMIQTGMMGSMMTVVLQNMQAMQRLQAMQMMQVMQAMQAIEEMDEDGQSSKKKKSKKKALCSQNALDKQSVHLELQRMQRIHSMQLVQMMQMQGAQGGAQGMHSVQSTHIPSVTPVTQTSQVPEAPQPSPPQASSGHLAPSANPVLPDSTLSSLGGMQPISAEQLERMWEPLPLGNGVPPIGAVSSHAAIPVQTAAPDGPDRPLNEVIENAVDPEVVIQVSGDPTTIVATVSEDIPYASCPSIRGDSLSGKASVGAVAALVAQATAAAVNNVKTAKKTAAAVGARQEASETIGTVPPVDGLAAVAQQKPAPKGQAEVTTSQQMTQDRYLPSPVRKAPRSKSRKAARRSRSRKSKKSKSGSSNSSSSSSSSKSSRRKRGRKRKKSRSRSRDHRKARASKFKDKEGPVDEETMAMPRLPLPQPQRAATDAHVPDWMSDLVQQRPKGSGGKGAKGQGWFKALTILSTQVGHLIGPNGTAIMAIRKASGADIKIDHGRGKAYGTVTITGNVEMAERLIFERLASMPQSNMPLIAS